MHKKGIKKVKVKMMTDLDAGWLAGIIDGEGCISLYKRPRRNNRFEWKISLTIANTNLDMCKRIEQLMDGSFHIKPEDRERNHKKVYVFQANMIGIKSILPQLNLIAKREQQKLILEALKLADNIQYEIEGDSIIRSKEHDAKMEEIYQRMKILNKRGVIEEETPKERVKRGNRITIAKHTKYIQKEIKKILNNNALGCNKKIEMIKRLKQVNPEVFISVVRDGEIWSRWSNLAGGYIQYNNIIFSKRR